MNNLQSSLRKKETAKDKRIARLARGRQNIANPSVVVPHDFHTGRKEKRIHHKGQKAFDFHPGMAEVAEVVANQNKDIRFVPRVSHYEGAKMYADNKPGWNAFEEDIIGDETKEVFITDNRGNIRYLNGFTTKNSNLPINRIHNKMNINNVHEGTKISKKVIRELANSYVIVNGRVQYDDSVAPPDIMPYIRAVRKPIRAKNAFRKLIYDFIIEQWEKEGVLEFLEGHDKITKARFFQMLLRNCYRNVIENEVFVRLGLNDENPNFPEEVKKIKKKKQKFEDACLEIVAEAAALSDEEAARKIYDIMYNSLQQTNDEFNQEDNIRRVRAQQERMNKDAIEQFRNDKQEQSRYFWNADQNKINWNVEQYTPPQASPARRDNRQREKVQFRMPGQIQLPNNDDDFLGN